MGSEVWVRRARRQDLEAIAAIVQGVTQEHIIVGESDVLDWLLGKGLFVAADADGLVGVAGWQAENLVAVTDVFYLSLMPVGEEAGRALLDAVEAEACTLMCEANVVVVHEVLSEHTHRVLEQKGYEQQSFDALHRIWREVLGEYGSGEMDLMVKRLRDRMVMVPL